MENDTREMTIWFSSPAGSETCSTIQYESFYAQNEIFQTAFNCYYFDLK